MSAASPRLSLRFSRRPRLPSAVCCRRGTRSSEWTDLKAVVPRCPLHPPPPPPSPPQYSPAPSAHGAAAAPHRRPHPPPRPALLPRLGWSVTRRSQAFGAPPQQLHGMPLICIMRSITRHLVLHLLLQPPHPLVHHHDCSPTTPSIHLQHHTHHVQRHTRMYPGWLTYISSQPSSVFTPLLIPSLPPPPAVPPCQSAPPAWRLSPPPYAGPQRRVQRRVVLEPLQVHVVRL